MMGWLKNLRKKVWPTTGEWAMRQLENYSPCTVCRVSDLNRYERWLLEHGFLKTRPASNGGIWVEKNLQATGEIK